MGEIYIKKSDLSDYLGKLFTKDLISIDDLLNKLEDLSFEVEHLEETIKDMQQPQEQDYEEY